MFDPIPLPVIPPEIIIASRITNDALWTLNTLKANYLQSYNSVWNNPDATPDKIVAAFGTSAVELFTISAATAQLLYACGITDIPLTMPSGWNFQANQDGSITLTPAS